MMAMPAPTLSCLGIDSDLYPLGHSLVEVMVSSSLIQVSIRTHKSSLLLTTSSWMSQVLLTTDLQLISAPCISAWLAQVDCELLFFVMMVIRLFLLIAWNGVNGSVSVAPW